MDLDVMWGKVVQSLMYFVGIRMIYCFDHIVKKKEIFRKFAFFDSDLWIDYLCESKDSLSVHV